MNLLDDIIMDKFDKIIKIVVIVISLAIVIASYGGKVKEGIPKMQGIVNAYEEGKELLEVLPEKEEQFDSKDVVYGYIVYLSEINGIENTNPLRVQAICSEEENKLLENIASNLKFNVSTTEEELEKMKDKQYALKRFGLDNYTTIYNIVQTHKDDF